MTDEQWRARQTAWQDRVETRLTVLETKGAVDEVHRINVETRLKGIEGTLVWLTRLIIGALILAAVGFALNGGFSV